MHLDGDGDRPCERSGGDRWRSAPFPPLDRLLFGDAERGGCHISHFHLAEQSGRHFWIRDRQWTGLGDMDNCPVRCRGVRRRVVRIEVWFQDRERTGGQPDPFCCPRGSGFEESTRLDLNCGFDQIPTVSEWPHWGYEQTILYRSLLGFGMVIIDPHMEH